MSTPVRARRFGIAGFHAWPPPAASDEGASALLMSTGAGSVSVRIPITDALPSREHVDSFVARLQRWKSADLDIHAVLDGPMEAETAWNEFADFIAPHLTAWIQHWSIGRLPDTGWPQASERLPAFLTRVRHVSARLRSIDPRAIFHCGALGPGLPKSLAALYEHGAAGAFDILDLHLWMNPLMPDSIGGLRYFYDRVRETLSKAGDGARPVWWTEAGCPGLQNPAARNAWWLGKNPTERVQEEWVRVHFDKVLSWPGVERVFWSRLQDDGTSAGEGATGLFRHDGSPKPASDAFRQLAERS